MSMTLLPRSPAPSPTSPRVRPENPMRLAEPTSWSRPMAIPASAASAGPVSRPMTKRTARARSGVMPPREGVKQACLERDDQQEQNDDRRGVSFYEHQCLFEAAESDDGLGNDGLERAGLVLSYLGHRGHREALGVDAVEAGGDQKVSLLDVDVVGDILEGAQVKLALEQAFFPVPLDPDGDRAPRVGEEADLRGAGQDGLDPARRRRRA